ncbi:beta-ketoacyl synthase N-terminal-like domain-containing protein, partial [Streptomyces sp. NPDC006552]|uniref:type I polyketide synthase n=1 Tax=Streptomyces sp. NPDC006552 TaxID=3157179 RepID=UPI0033AA620C
TELWRKGDTAYGVVRLPEGLKPDGFGVHPALLDAALHTLVAVRQEEGAERPVFLPFEWTGVDLYASGATEMRVRVALDPTTDEHLSLTVADGAGQPVLAAHGLRIREASAEQIRAGEPADHVYRVEFRTPRTLEEGPVEPAWVLGGTGEVARRLDADQFARPEDLFARLDEGAEAPGRVIVDCTADAGGAGDPLAVTARSLETVQRLLADERLARAGLAWVTRGAVDAGDGVRDLAHAPVWGLLRAVRAEYPERDVRSVDVEASADGVEDALAVAGEPELAVRDGQIHAARLVRATTTTTPPVDTSTDAIDTGADIDTGTGIGTGTDIDTGTDATAAKRSLDPDGNVLITGGSGELGRALAGHLVRTHGVRHLVLTSRRGPDAPGTEAFVAELTEAGAVSVRVVACDTADRDRLRDVLTDRERPWTGIFHLAAVLDDGLLSAQSPERLAGVWGPKAAAATHLDELSRELGLDLAAFVLFSSAAGVLGGAGQANYAAANAYVDALAVRRRADGLAALSLSWGLWQQAGTGLTAALGQAELARMRRGGVGALSERQALAALDAALGSDLGAHLVPVKLELAALRRDPDGVPALLRGLVRPARRRAGEAAAQPSGLRERLAALPEAERLVQLTGLVRGAAATVLGAGNAEAVGARQVLKELGIDSLMAVELRRRLSAETGLSLPSTLAFDYPTPAAIAGLLLDKLALSRTDGPAQATRRPAATGAGEPIAIVSMACRLPGDIDTPEGYWDLLASGGDAVSGLPPRWSDLDLYDPDPDAAGKSYAREGGFIHQAEEFDAAFFGISQREALAMDPQQRLVLETAWEALERAGIRPGTLSESRTGVYLGAMSSDYGEQGRELDAFDGYVSTGNASSVVSGRVAYALGLQGPAVTIDTACSSSLVALHLASTALRQGECELALVGGVTVMSTPRLFVEFSRLKGMAPDGRCKSFSALADGAGWSDGCGILVLKPLSVAERDGDRVLAVIRGSAVNQDGRSQGLTAPNGPAQQRVIQDALAAARLGPADIDAIEAHGTGTPLGDPIEAGALAEVFGPGRVAERPVWLGSSKSNIGHAQAAAGVAGLMKMVLALQHETLPKTLHADRPSPHIQWADSGLALLDEARPWPKDTGHVRRAGVSSFGLSGTNAHVVLEEPAPAPAPVPVPDEDRPVPLVVSGRDEDAMRAQAARWADWLGRPGNTAVTADAAFTAAQHRTHFECRAGVAAGSVAEAVEGLRALAEGRSHLDVVEGCPAGDGTAVLFTGQGSQRLGMGRALYGAFPVFREAF